jgi:sugar phosphate isomerase/epimerase
MPKKRSTAHTPLPSANPFKLGAPSMIYGNDMVTNAEILSKSGSGLNFTEILLFHTPELHNIPSTQELQALEAIQDNTHCIYTVHLPASLEIASDEKKVREQSIQRIVDIWLKTSVLQPEYYILHIPITPPTLIADPHRYFKSRSSQSWGKWTSRAMESLRRIQENVGETSKLLIENINYSPEFLEPFLEAGLCRLCLDMGHLLLGDEPIREVLKNFLDHIQEIHLHGVKNYSEHLSLNVLPRNEVIEWFSCLNHWNYQGLVNLEVFSPEDLATSLSVISGIMKALTPGDSHQD